MAANRTKRLAAPLAVLALAGCASFSTDGGFGSVEQTAQRAVGAQPRWQRTDADRAEATKLVRAKLTQPLSAEDAVQVALVHNPGLQATYAELGIAEADVVAAGRLPASASHRSAPSAATMSRISSNRSASESSRFSPCRCATSSSRAASSACRPTSPARRSESPTTRGALGSRPSPRRRRCATWRRCRRRPRRRRARAADGAAGNFPRLQQMREQVFYAERDCGLARAQPCGERRARAPHASDGPRRRRRRLPFARAASRSARRPEIARGRGSDRARCSRLDIRRPGATRTASPDPSGSCRRRAS